MRARVWMLAAILSAPSVGWGAGALDPTFGVGGIVAPPNDDATYVATTTAAAGGLFAAGRDDDDPLLVRLLDDGSPNPGFGVGGFVTTPPTAATDWVFTGIAEQPDGMVVVSGSHGQLVPPYFVAPVGAVARYQANGAVDADFGAGGATSLGGPTEVTLHGNPNLQGDGKIVVGGAAFSEARLWRFDADGTLDEDFGLGGAVTLNVGGSARQVNDHMVLPDGKILALLIRWTTATDDNDAVLVRLDDAGQPDDTFGDDGVVVPPIPGDVVPAAFARQPDGKIVIVGYTPSFGGEQQAFAARVDEDGALEPTFGGDGVVLTPETTGSTFILSVAIAPDGRIIAGGHFGVFGIVMVGYRPNGSLDTAFAVNGLVVQSGLVANALSVQQDGKLVSAGGSVARWLLDDTPSCSAAPLPSCRTAIAAGKAKLTLRDAAQDSLAWRWKQGAAVGDSELGNPVASTGYALCVYDGTSSLVAALRAPPGGTCGTKPCWSTLGAHGFRRTDKTGASDGLMSLRVQAGPSGKSQALVKAKGPSLPTPSLPLPVRVQLQASNGLCLGSSYSTAGRNEAGRFQAKSD